MPAHDGARSHDQPHPGHSLDGQRPGQQGQPRPVRPRQPRMHPRPLALGDGELMAQHQDLGVLPPRLTARQPEQRHDTGHDQEDQLQARKPKIIPPPDRPRPADRRRATTKTGRVPQASAQVAQVFGTHSWPVPCGAGRCCSAPGTRPGRRASTLGPGSGSGRRVPGAGCR
jgi:hypothetical protein